MRKNLRLPFLVRACARSSARGLVWFGLVWCRGVRSIGKGCRSRVPMEERSIQMRSMRLAMSHSFCLPRGRLAVIALIPATMATFRPPRQLSFPMWAATLHSRNSIMVAKEEHLPMRFPSRCRSLVMSHYVTLADRGKQVDVLSAPWQFFKIILGQGDKTCLEHVCGFI